MPRNHLGVQSGGGFREEVVAPSIAEVDSDLITLDLRARQLDLLADVTRRFIDVVAAQERIRFADENVAIAQRTLDAIAARVKAARSPIAEESRARITLTRAQIDRRQATLALETARSALSLTWGRVDPQFTSPNADLFAFQSLELSKHWPRRSSVIRHYAPQASPAARRGVAIGEQSGRTSPQRWRA